MAVSNNFSASSLDFNGFGGLSQPTALVWGADGRLYVTEVDGDVHVLTIAFGDPDPTDGDTTARFHVTDQVTLNHVKSIPNHNDDGSANAATKRQVTGIDVTPQFDANGDPVMIGGKPAVTVYVTSSDSRIGAGGGGADANLDTNSGIITKLTQTGPNSWDAVDLVRGLARSEENHALNGLEVIQVLDADGKLVSERLIVANGGNANNGAPSNHFAGQQETAYSAAILEVDLTMLASMPVLTDGGRKYVYDVPTLDDPALPGADDGNDPFGGNDGFNGGKIDPAGPIGIYSPGYRNAYDVEVTEDGRVYTYDNGANNLWGGRPIGEAGDNGASSDFAQALGYIALNLNNGDGSTKDPMSLVAWDPKNYDQMHEVTRSDDLAGRVLAAGQGGAQTYTLDGLTYVYGGHPNPTRAEGSRAGLLFTPEDGVGNAFLLVSNVDSAGNGGGSDYDEVIAWLQAVEADNAAYPTTGVYGADDQELTRKVLAVTPGVLYDIYGFADGSGQVVVAGGAAPQGGTFLGQAGLPADIGEIIAAANPAEGNYLEGGFTDGALDSGKGSINGLTEYTSTVLDGGGVDMSGALIAASLNQGSLIVIGRDANGVVQTTTGGSGETLAADRTVLQAGGGPLGLASIGDEFGAMGLGNAFRGSIWVATYKQNGPFIEIFQPANGAVPLAGQDVTDDTDADLDGLNELIDPFEFSAENGYALEVGQKIVLDFTQQNTNFPGTLSDTGFLGAALDGVTPNQDARTAAENFPADQQQDGLYDNGGNIIPGGNAPTFQIKNAQPGTAVGSANSARDAVHTGIRPDPDVGRILATLDMANWIPSQQGGIVEGQVSGLMFGDGTQSNFLRIVMGAVGGTPYLEVGVETGDVYQRITRVDVPGLADPAVTGVELRLEIAIDAGFAVGAAYRLDGAADFVALPLNGFVLPQGVLRDVLTGAHQIAGQTSGAAIGLIAEDVAADTLTTVDFNELKIEA
ncbi:hypothetical protein O4G76_19730, partial [Limimaricola sp. G21655-S1]|uniref:hypothetical protein n=1 Tax=Limimaricola sp. G21655-S1 TaxID=3014768 RepID=UPI0022AEDD9C